METKLVRIAEISATSKHPIFTSVYLSDWSACGRTACKVECSGCLGQIKWMIKAIMNAIAHCQRDTSTNVVSPAATNRRRNSKTDVKAHWVLQ